MRHAAPKVIATARHATPVDDPPVLAPISLWPTIPSSHLIMVPVCPRYGQPTIIQQKGLMEALFQGQKPAIPAAH